MEKYELVTTNYSKETIIDEETYSVIITMGLHPLDGFTPDFSKDILSISHNSQTGYEVDAQRLQEIEDYINLINN